MALNSVKYCTGFLELFRYFSLSLFLESVPFPNELVTVELPMTDWPEAGLDLV